MSKAAILQKFGARYFAPGERTVVHATADNLYHYTAYVGPHDVQVDVGDSCFYLIDADSDGKPDHAAVVRGSRVVVSPFLAVVIRGYMPPNRMVSLTERTMLPYVNGCSTRQLIHPERLGDPTLQMLDIPPHAAEQAHHIHSTVRVVYILRGQGTSVVGMEKLVESEPLIPGMVMLIEPMCPHHFETEDDHLICVPLHVWSSVGGAENNHPMFNGTHLMNQGE